MRLLTVTASAATHHDRLLNQARGLLTFDGLVLAALGVLYRESHRIPASLVLGGYASAILATSILLVSQFSVYFGGPSTFQDPKREFSSSLRQTLLDGKTIVVADILSFVAMLSLLVRLDRVFPLASKPLSHSVLRPL